MPVIAAGPAYAAAMAEIHADAFPPASAWSERHIRTQLMLSGVFGLLHDAGGMVLARVAADEAEILTVAVACAARRGGIGRMLVRRATEAATRRGAQALFLEVSVANMAARALYVGLGFLPVGRRSGYYEDGSDAIVLRWGPA